MFSSAGDSDLFSCGITVVFISGMRMAFNVCGEFAGFKFIFFKHKFELDFSAWFDVIEMLVN